MSAGVSEPGNGRRSEPSTVDTLPLTPAKPGAGRVECAGLSDVGKVRPNNEDQFLICRLCKSLEVLQSSLPPEAGAALTDRPGYLLVVADGIGGSGGGERASAVVVEEAKRYVLQTAKWFFSLDDPGEEVRLRLLRESLERVDRRLIAEAEANPALAGMGTTLIAATVVSGDVFMLHVGDSRAYLFRDGELSQLTRDHTLAQHLLDAGVLQPAQAKVHHSRHVLTNALGGTPGVKGEIVKLRLADGDRLLLCTDGLSDMVGDEQIAELLRAHPRPEEACRALVSAALDHGGRDNVTVIVAAYSA
jgi:PPM family protein phosphatase